MAEALGIAASLVQLADVTIRASLGLYKFFYALQKAQPKFDGFIIVLQDVHDAIQLLRKVALNSPTGPALSEVEAASLKRQLVSIGDELSSLEKFATSKDPSKLTSRVKWVFKTADVDRALQKLESHKTTLLIFLQTVTMCLFKGDKCGQLLLSQNSATTQLGSLVSQIKQQGMDSSAMRTEIGMGLNDITSGMNSTLDLYQQSLQDGFANVSRSIESSEANTGNILRHEIDWARDNLTPAEWADSINDGLMTPTAYAKAAGILPEWLEALAAAGYDPGQVVLEDERRRREFRWLHGVKSSAIDAEELSTSQSTFRRRAGRATGG